MSVDIFSAIIELCGSVNFSIDGNDYDSIVWRDENKQKPSKEEIEQKIKEIDYKFSNELEKDSWMKYRQELRDLTDKYKDVLLDSETNQLVNVIWPTPPDKM
jgi:hypothetical protein